MAQVRMKYDRFGNPLVPPPPLTLSWLTRLRVWQRFCLQDSLHLSDASTELSDVVDGDVQVEIANGDLG